MLLLPSGSQPAHNGSELTWNSSSIETKGELANGHGQIQSPPSAAYKTFQATWNGSALETVTEVANDHERNRRLSAYLIR